MSLFGVRVNGVPRWTGGSTNAPTQANTGLAVVSSAAAVAVYNLGGPGTADQERLAMQFTANFAEVGTDKAGSGSSRNLRIKSAQSIVFQNANADAWVIDNSNPGVLRPASSAVQPAIGSATVPIGGLFLAAGTKLDFGQTASTFGSIATITNGPRAANPVAWVEVSYNAGGSTGRIPIW